MRGNRELIGEFRKNSREWVKVQLSLFTGKLYVDIRIFVQGPGKEPAFETATKKGICLAPDLILALIPLLKRAQERLGELKGGGDEDAAGPQEWSESAR